MNDGGPAFPRSPVLDPGTWKTIKPGYPGMSLRDWFAGMALSSELAQSGYNAETIAHWAYCVADAMLTEREKQETTGPAAVAGG